MKKTIPNIDYTKEKKLISELFYESIKKIEDVNNNLQEKQNALKKAELFNNISNALSRLEAFNMDRTIDELYKVLNEKT